MKVKVITRHKGKEVEGTFPTFAKGTAVNMCEECTHFLHWYSCDIDGHKTYVPKAFVRNGKLICDYNPTELTAEVGEVLEVRQIVYAWLLAVNQKGVTGWVPAEVVLSEEEDNLDCTHR